MRRPKNAWVMKHQALKTRKSKQLKSGKCIAAAGSNESLNKAIDEVLVDFLADSGAAFRVVGLEAFNTLMKTANMKIKLNHLVSLFWDEDATFLSECIYFVVDTHMVPEGNRIKIKA